MTVEITEWIDSMADAFVEFAEQMMDMPGGVRQPDGNALPQGLGAYIALVSEATSLQIAVVADADTCYKLGRALLMMEPDEELSQADMADAMNEVINVIAGGVKTRMADKEAGLGLGLPMFIEGRVLSTAALEWAVGSVKVNDHEVHLVVLRQPK